MHNVKYSVYIDVKERKAATAMPTQEKLDSTNVSHFGRKTTRNS